MLAGAPPSTHRWNGRFRPHSETKKKIQTLVTAMGSLFPVPSPTHLRVCDGVMHAHK
jgi:hypothetical protein